MAKFGEIVAYQYQADLYCPDCIVAVMHWSPMEDRATAELALDDMAHVAGINRADESTFDSGDFPKVVLFDHLHDQGRTFNCGRCQEELES